MERLTEKTVGCFEYALKDHKAVPGEFGTYDAFFDYSMAVKRLGHYEDTGLEPEEIADAVTAAKLMERSKIVSCFGVDADHIRDLLQAEQAGRLVVLPCKVGDTVYQIDAERVYESEVKWIIFDCDDIAFDERAIGVSIFLTREEAEASLAQEGGKGHA